MKSYKLVRGDQQKKENKQAIKCLPEEDITAKYTCDCYHPGAFYSGICYGTRELEECACGGDRLMCDFYKEVREKAEAEYRADVDKLELEFYREFIRKHDLHFEALSEWCTWKKSKEKK